MKQLSLALATLAGLASMATATTVPPRQETPTCWKKLPTDYVARVLPDEKEQFRLTDQTEVQLDGRACPYEKVPDSATIILLEVTSDKTVLKIHFRSKK